MKMSRKWKPFAMNATSFEEKVIHKSMMCQRKRLDAVLFFPKVSQHQAIMG